MNFWLYITEVGDAKLMLPAAAIIALWFVAARAWTLAALWAVGFGFACALVVTTKLAFIGWGIGFRIVDFTGISGHAMRSAAVIPVLACLAFQSLSKKAIALAIGAGYILAALVAASRLLLNAHSMSEVLAGLALGTVISMAVILRAQAHRALCISRGWSFGSLFVLVPVMFLEPAPTKVWLKDAALHLSGRTEPVKRLDQTW